MKEKTQLGLFGLLIGLPVAIFGAYILYEKALLSVILGHSHERAGLIERSQDAVWFWIYVGVYGVCGFAVFIAGAAMTVLSARKLVSPDK